MAQVPTAQSLGLSSSRSGTLEMTFEFWVFLSTPVRTRCGNLAEHGVAWEAAFPSSALWLASQSRSLSATTPFCRLASRFRAPGAWMLCPKRLSPSERSSGFRGAKSKFELTQGICPEGTALGWHLHFPFQPRFWALADETCLRDDLCMGAVDESNE